MASNAFAGLLNSSADRHSLLDDAQGIVAGSMLAVLGVSLLSGAGLLVCGTAGLAFLAHYATGLSFGLCFFVVNLPFYYLAFRRLGAAFTIKTFAAIALTSVLSEFISGFISMAHVDPIAGALFGGLVIGAGMLALFRHRASLGGIGILALYIQDRFGWRAKLRPARLRRRHPGALLLRRKPLHHRLLGARCDRSQPHDRHQPPQGSLYRHVNC